MVSNFLHLLHKPVSCTPILFKYAFSPQIPSRNREAIISLRRVLYIVLVLCFTDGCNSLYSFGEYIYPIHLAISFGYISRLWHKLREARI